MTMLGLLKSGKLILKCANDQERPDVTSWGATRESQLGFSHEETQHDGTVQSFVIEVMLRDRLGRPDVDPQRVARPQQFVIGNDEKELEFSVESISFVNRVNNQVWKRQKRIPNVTEDGETFLWFGECSWQKTSHWNKCSAYLQDQCLNKMRSLEWKQPVGKNIHGNICHWLVTKELSIFNARTSTSFRILCCALKRSIKIQMLT